MAGLTAGLPSLQRWTVTAVNLPEHARNAIHTDAGARAGGFPRALVAGVTTYAYLAHPAIVAWGLDWVEHGQAETRFRAPVFEDDQVDCVPIVDGLGDAIEARTPAPGAQPRAVMRLARHAGAVLPLRTGEALAVQTVTLAGEFGADYGVRVGDDLGLLVDSGIVHPAVWPALANRVVHEQVARGPWVHTRSLVRHHASARHGALASVSAVVVHRFDRHGERAVLDVRIESAGEVVATLEHEAIVALP